MARCGKSAMIFRRNRKIANKIEFPRGNSAAMSYTRCCATYFIPHLYKSEKFRYVHKQHHFGQSVLIYLGIS